MNRIELSAVLPNITSLSANQAQTLPEINSDYLLSAATIKARLGWSGSYTTKVRAVNQQTGEIFEEEQNSHTGEDWSDGYYRIYVRAYKSSASDPKPDFYELSKRPIYWNKSPMQFMTYIAPGEFIMGSPESEISRSTNESQHRVRITKGFYIMRTPCTTAFFNKVTGASGGDNKPKTSIRYSAYNNDGTYRSGDQNVYGTPPDSYWNTPYIYESQPRETAGGTPGTATTGGLITALSNARNADLTALIPTGYSWALPTEAQWEYACRAGTNTALNNGKNLISETDIKQAVLDEIAVYKQNGNALKVVAERRPNAWGLHDMIGNCWEWCRDWYQASLTAADDPFISTTTGVGIRVFRGGSYAYAASICRSARRNRNVAAIIASDSGFRLALVRS